MKKFALAVIMVMFMAVNACAEVPVWRILWIILPKMNAKHDGILYNFEMTEWEINKEYELASDVEKFIEEAAKGNVDVQITMCQSAMEVTTLTEDSWIHVTEKDFPDDVKHEMKLAEDKGHPYNFWLSCYKLEGDSDKINSYGGLGGGRYARVRAGFYWSEIYLLDVRVHELLHCFDWFYESLLGYVMPGTHGAEQWGYGGSEEKAQEYYHDTLAGSVWDESNDRYIGITPEMWQYHPGNTHEYDGHTYQFFNIKTSWEDAREYCDAIGGHLVSISDAKEQAMIEMFMKISDKSGWSDTAYWAGGEKTSGSWKWITSEDFSYINFNDRSDSGDKYLQLKAWGEGWSKGGAWSTADGNRRERSFFVCEWDYIRGDLKLEPTVTTSSLPDANVKSEYYKQLYSAGAEPLTWEAVGLPDGLTCNVSGEISGQAQTEGSYNVTVTAKNSKGIEMKTFAINVGKRLGVELSAENFPDEVFRNYVSENFDEDGDGWLDEAEIAEVRNIDVRGTEEAKGNITSLKGIEYFTNLNNLHCEYNKITELDLSRNINLSWLECQNNGIKSLDISGCPSLWVIICCDNEISALDISVRPSLNYLNCSVNKISRLDTSSNTGLSVLLCGHNDLRSLDLSKNENLTWLACDNNRLELLDLSRNVKLETVYCYNNSIIWLNVDNCAELSMLYCYGNKIPKLNKAGCTKLQAANFIHDGETEIVSEHVDIPDEGISPEILTESLTNTITAQPYTTTLTASGTTPITWTLKGRLPQGLTLSPSGLISGTPQKAGKFTFTVQAANDYGSDTHKFTLQVLDPANIITASLKPATFGKSYSVTLKAKGSKPLSWSATGLPDGLTINAKTGRISGKPSAHGKFNVKITASNEAGSTEKSLQLAVKGVAPKLSGSLARATINEPYSSGLRLTAGTYPLTWSCTGTLPAGLTFDTSTGKISGTPTSYEKSGFKFTITASNDEGRKSKSVKLNVKAIAPKITVKKLPDAEKGKSYTVTLTATGSTPITWKADGLPEGLYVDGSTIKGTPKVAGDKFTVTLYAENPVKSVKKSLTLKVASSSDTRLPVFSKQDGFTSFTDDVPAHEYSVRNVDTGYVIVAELGEISCDISGMYDFSVTLSDDADIGAELVYMAGSDVPSDDDDIAEFYDETGEEVTCVPESRRITLSVWMNEGVIYSPVIAVKK